MQLFLSAFLSFILYALVFFRLRGNIVVTGWHVRFRMLEKDESGWRGREHADSRSLSIAKQMILYPVRDSIFIRLTASEETHVLDSGCVYHPLPPYRRLADV